MSGQEVGGVRKWLSAEIKSHKTINWLLGPDSLKVVLLKRTQTSLDALTDNEVESVQGDSEGCDHHTGEVAHKTTKYAK